MVVKAGTTDLRNKSAVVFGVTNSAVYPNYKYEGPDDIALLTLNTSITRYSWLESVELQWDDSNVTHFEDQDAIGMGFGAFVGVGLLPSNQLRQNNLTTITDAECKRAYSEKTSTQICTKNIAKNACNVSFFL